MPNSRVITGDPCIDVDIRTQTAGTCWYHALVNPFLLSNRLRPYLYKALADYINKFRTKAQLAEWIEPQQPSCVSSIRQFTRIFAMKKMYGALYGTLRSGYRTTRRMNTTSQNNIRNLLKSLRTKSTNAPWSNQGEKYIVELLERIGYANYKVLQGQRVLAEKGPPGQKDFIVVLPVQITTGNVDTIMIHEGHRYKLESASINLAGEKFTGVSSQHSLHSITGFKCKSNDQYMIYDSNMLKSYPCDWAYPMRIIMHAEYQTKTNRMYRLGINNTNSRIVPATNAPARWVEAAIAFSVYVRASASNRDADYQAYSTDASKITVQAIRNRTAANAPEPGIPRAASVPRAPRYNGSGPSNLNALILHIRSKMNQATNQAEKNRIKQTYLDPALQRKRQRNAAEALRNLNQAATNPNLNARIINLRARLRREIARESPNKAFEKKIRNHLQAAINKRGQVKAVATKKQNENVKALREKIAARKIQRAFRDRPWTENEKQLYNKAVALGGQAAVNMVKSQRPFVKNAVMYAVSNNSTLVINNSTWTNNEKSLFSRAMNTDGQAAMNIVKNQRNAIKSAVHRALSGPGRKTVIFQGK